MAIRPAWCLNAYLWSACVSPPCQSTVSLQGTGLCTLWRFLKGTDISRVGPLLCSYSFPISGCCYSEDCEKCGNPVPDFYQPRFLLFSSSVVCNPAELERHLVQVHILISDSFFLQGTIHLILAQRLFSTSPSPGLDIELPGARSSQGLSLSVSTLLFAQTSIFPLSCSPMPHNSGCPLESDRRVSLSEDVYYSLLQSPWLLKTLLCFS